MAASHCPHSEPRTAFPHARGQLWAGPRERGLSYSAAVCLSVYSLNIQVTAQPLAVHTYKGDRDSAGHGLTHSRSQLPADKTSNRQREARGGGARA